MPAEPLPIDISEDLDFRLAGASVRLTPSQGLDLAEQIARKAFRRALAEEAASDAQPQTGDRA